MIVRGVVTKTNAGTAMQGVWTDGRAGEGTDAIEHFEPYGFTSRPLAGAEPIILEIGGSPDHHVAICVADRRYRLTGLAGGGVAMYDNGGHIVKLTSAGITLERNSDVIFLGDGGLAVQDGVVTGRGIDSLTGVAYYLLGNSVDDVRAG